MLQELREHAKSWVAYTLLFLLVLSFAIWGIGDIFRNNSSRDWVAKVDGHKIHPNLLTREFNNEVAQIRSMLGAGFTNEKAKEMGMLENALNRLVTITSLNLETNRLGFIIPRSQIVRSLESTPQLRDRDGKFNTEMFQRILQAQGMNENTFIETQKQIAARNMLISGLIQPLNLPETALNDLAAAQAQKRIAEYVRIDPTKFATHMPSEDAIKEYYEGHKSDFMLPELRSFKVLAATAKDASKDIMVSEDDIKAAFNDHRAAYDIPEKRNVEQIVVSDESTAKTILDAAKATSFKEAAKNAGLDIVKLDGYTTKDLPDDYANAVFKSAQGQMAGPVQTPLGWHVFVVNKITPAKEVSFEDVKEKIRSELQTDRATESMVRFANKMDDLLAAGKKLDDISSEMGIPTTTYENRNSAGQDSNNGAAVDYAEDVMRAAFQYAEGETSPILESNDGTYLIVEVTKITPTHAEELAKVKDKVIKAWQQKEQAKKATEEANTLLTHMKEGKPLSALTGTGFEKHTTSALVFDAVQQKELPREALAPLFNLKQGEAVAISTPEGEMVLRVKEIIAGNEKDIATRKAALKQKLLQEWSTLHTDELAHGLRNLYPIEVDKDLINTLFSDNAS